MALPPSSFDDSIASSDLDFSDGFDDISSSHTSPMNRTLSDVQHDHPPRDPVALPPSPWDDSSSMIDHEFSDLEIQTLFAVVQRAQDIWPTVPPDSRLSVPVLFKAYYEILPQRGLDPYDDQQIAKLIFKVGGVKTGGTLEEKFTAAMARMGIELQLYDLQSQASDTEGEDIPMPDLPRIEEGDYDDYKYGAYNGTAHEQDDTMVTDSTDTGLSVITEESHTYTRTHEVDDNIAAPAPAQEEHDEAAKEHALESTAVAFRQEHKFEFPVPTAFQHWYGRAAFASHILAQFQLARQADLEEDAQDKFQEWRSVAIEAQEVPLYQLPGNIYSKQTEQVAARAYEIYALKSTLNRWRQRTRTTSHRGALNDTKSTDRMQRIATKAHNNLMLSRAFTRWYNRAEQEAEKAQIASKAYETSLKAKLFDSKQFLPLADPPSAAEGPIMQSVVHEKQDGALSNTNVQSRLATASLATATSQHVANMEPRRDQSPRRKHIVEAITDPKIRKRREDERQQAEARRSALKARTLSLVRALSERNQREGKALSAAASEDGRDSATKAEPDTGADANEAAEVTTLLAEEELDERTLIARRHILRMRYFDAWEIHTKAHLSLVKEFERRKAIDPWRRRAFELPARLQQATDHLPQVKGRALRKWLRRARTHEQLGEKANWAHKKARGSRTLAAWLASSKEKQRSASRQRQALSAWFDHPNTESTLAACADKFHVFQQTALGFSGWRRAAAGRSVNLSRLEDYGTRAGYYYAATSVLRAWKAVSRETAIETAQRRRVVDRWARTQQEEAERQRTLHDYAERAAFYNNVIKVLPKWRARAKELAETRQEQEIYCQRACYYYSTKGVLDIWRAEARQKRKNRLREAHLETRRLVKKGAGERAVRHWLERLGPRTQRVAVMDEALQDVVGNRKWHQSLHAMQTWREKALQKQAIIDTQQQTSRQGAFSQWRLLAEEGREAAYGAQTHWEEAACTRALKRWNLRRDQNASRPLMVAYALEKKERRMLRQRLERWYEKTAAQQASIEASAIPLSSSRLSAVEDEAPTPSVLGKSFDPTNNRWMASLKQPSRVEDEIYVPTPGRPSLMLGDFGTRDMLTTTPLGPVPRRTWHPDTNETSMRGSALGSRASRARKNLRVSFAR